MIIKKKQRRHTWKYQLTTKGYKQGSFFGGVFSRLGLDEQEIVFAMARHKSPKKLEQLYYILKGHFSPSELSKYLQRLKRKGLVKIIRH